MRHTSYCPQLSSFFFSQFPPQERPSPSPTVIKKTISSLAIFQFLFQRYRLFPLTEKKRQPNNNTRQHIRNPSINFHLNHGRTRLVSAVFCFPTIPSFSSFFSFQPTHCVTIVPRYIDPLVPNTNWSPVFHVRTPVTVQKTAKQKAAGLSSAQAVAQVRYHC